MKSISYILIISFLVIVSILSVVALNQLKRNSLEQTRTSLLTILAIVDEAHHIWIDQRKHDIRELASRQEIISHTMQLAEKREKNEALIGSKSLIELRRIIKLYLNKYGDQGFFLIGHDRTSIASMRDDNIGITNLIHFQKSELIDRSFQGDSVFIPPIVSDVPLMDKTGQIQSNLPTLFITTPVRSNEGDIIAVLALRIDPGKHFTRITQLGRMGKTGETYAFDNNATLLSNSRFDQQLVNARLMQSNQNSILNIRIVDPGGNLLKGFEVPAREIPLPLTTMAQSAVSGHNDVNIDGYRDYRGAMVFGAWVWEKNLNFGIATEIDVEEALAPYYNTRNILLTVVVLTCLLGFTLRSIIHRMQHQAQIQLEEAYAVLDDRVKERTEELEITQIRLSKTNNELQQLAITDGLTRLYNRRHFDDRLVKEWSRCQRNKENLAVIIFDVDYIKSYNDSYGHQYGDNCLKTISELLLGMHFAKRPGDCIARYGGEEFVILLADIDEGYAHKIADNIRQAIYDLGIPHEDRPDSTVDRVTVSVGVAIETASSSIAPEQVVSRADQALYAAKNSGRNQVCLYQINEQKTCEVIPLINRSQNNKS
jgi:diguanylate cyclase (GGDEF)-like protein